MKFLPNPVCFIVFSLLIKKIVLDAIMSFVCGI